MAQQIRFLRFLGQIDAFLVLLVGISLGFITPAYAQTMVMPGNFNVSPQGAAALNIPISVPPGTNSLVPSLSINYESGGSNGLLGVGWTLQGLSAITRCPKTITQDGSNVPVSYTATDRFCLNGQRLILVQGTYGAAGSVYRTELESYGNITAEGSAGTGPAYFIVQTKSGQTWEYGNPSTRDGSTSVATNAGVVLPSAAPTVTSWLLDKITDISGNYMVVLYRSNPSGISGNTEVVPAEIDYTGNPGGSGTNTANSYPQVLPYNKITFVYANNTRPDITPKYTDGNLLETTQRLTDIETWSGTQSSPGSAEVSDYKFTYSTSSETGRSLLTSLQLCDPSGNTCLPARTFSYSDSQPNSFILKSSTLSVNYGAPPINWYFIRGSFTSDGRTDFAAIEGTTLNVYLSNGDGTFREVTSTLSNNFGVNNSGVWGVVEGDFNGDGKTDFALVEGSECNAIIDPKNGGTKIIAEQPGYIYEFISQGNGSFSQEGPFTEGASDPNNTIACGSTAQLIPTEQAGGPNGFLVAGDFVGNGLTDFGYIANNIMYSFISQKGGGFQSVVSTLPVNYGDPAGKSMPLTWTMFSGDFTGKGLTDFAFIQGTSSGNNVDTYLSNGNGTFSRKNQVLYGNLGDPPSAGWTPATGDFNGDGLTDVVFIRGNSSATAPNQNQIYPLLSKGDGTFVAESTQFADGYLGAPPSSGWSSVQGDFNGDGLTDAGFIGSSTLYDLASNGEFSSAYSNSSPYVPITSGLPNSNFGNPPNLNWAVLSGDYNGNGTTDLALLQNNTLDVYLNENSIPDLLTSFSDGIGASTTISYGTPSEGFTSSTATPSSTYTTGPFTNYYAGWDSPTCTSTLPAPTNVSASGGGNAQIIDVAPAFPIVVSTSSSTGLATGNPYESNFAYACLRADINGRGLLGFAQQVVIDPQTNIVQTTNYQQNFPFIGLESSQTKQYTGSEAGAQTGVILDKITNSYSALTPYSAVNPSSPTLPWGPVETLAETAPQFPFLAQKQITSNDLDGAALPSVTTSYQYDAYGEATTITVTKSDGSSQTTNNTYGADNGTSPNWILGRLTQSAVTSTTP